MLPTYHDLLILAESNRERTRKWERDYILLASAQGGKRRITSVIVRFGAWLEKVGARLQTRYAKQPNLEVSMQSSSDVSLQSC